MATVEDVDWIVPQWRSTSERPASPLLNRILGALGYELRHAKQAQPVEMRDHWDLMVAFCLTENDLRQIERIPRWRSHCDRAVCWIGEFWIRKLDQYSGLLRLFDHFDEIFLDFGSTVDVLSQRLQRPVHFLPFGCDTQRFAPPTRVPARTIDVLSVGRRSEVNHAALSEYERRTGIHYQYDSTWLTDVNDFDDHRHQLIHRIHRAKTFLVGPAKMNVPSQTLGQSELSARYIEGVAGGAVLVGEPPQTDRFAELFDWPDALVPWTMTSSDTKVIDELLRDAPRLQAAHRQNVVQCLQRHDWIHRWETILHQLGLNLSPTGEARLQQLRARAAEIEPRQPQPVGH